MKAKERDVRTAAGTAVRGGRRVGRGGFAQSFEAWDRPQELAADIFEESTELLCRLLRERAVSWDGKWRTPLREVTIRPFAVQEQVPVWCGSTSSIDLAARLGLGMEWVVAVTKPDSLVEPAERYQAAWSESGHEGPARIRMAAHFHVARTSQEARRRFRPYHTNYLQQIASLRRANFRGSATNRTAPPTPKVGAPAGKTPLADILITDDGPIVPFCGSPQEIVDRVGRAGEQLGLTGIALCIDLGGMPDEMVLGQIDELGADVLPHLERL